MEGWGFQGGLDKKMMKRWFGLVGPSYPPQSEYLP